VTAFSPIELLFPNAKSDFLRGCPKTQFFKKFSDFLRTKFSKKASKKVFSDSLLTHYTFGVFVKALLSLYTLIATRCQVQFILISCLAVAGRILRHQTVLS
jgi:hypothetical protein